MSDKPSLLRSDEDVDGILMLALRRQGRDDQDLRSRLLASAEELGISEEELALAEAEYAKVHNQKADFIEFRQKQVREFREHFFTYIVVNTFLVAIDFLSDQRIEWAMWPILGWGIGLAFHAWGSLNASSDSFQSEFAHYIRKKERKESATRPVDD